MFKILKTKFFFNCGFNTNLIRVFLLHVNSYELSKLNTLKPSKTKISSTLLIKKRFQGYRFASGIVMFSWKAT